MEICEHLAKNKVFIKIQKTNLDFELKRAKSGNKKRGRKPLDLPPEEKRERRLKQMREACARYRVRLREKNSLLSNKDVTASKHKGLNNSRDYQEYKAADS